MSKKRGRKPSRPPSVPVWPWILALGVTGVALYTVLKAQTGSPRALLTGGTPAGQSYQNAARLATTLGAYYQGQPAKYLKKGFGFELMLKPSAHPLIVAQVRAEALRSSQLRGNKVYEGERRLGTSVPQVYFLFVDRELTRGDASRGGLTRIV